ncbi:MAG TPA: DNA topoisomerase (ATP-hydrolyzing) subunit B [Candidatus Paceibacterota bacterium]|nr:DNA topoisomerase (ATP-hydrolyzing) subunit B [Candidatus Paceibacterota bacterium]
MAKNDEKNKQAVSSYSAKDIYVLEGLEPVRKRPGMYIGSTGPDGLHHLIWEIVDNSIDEAMGGFAHNIRVELLKDNKISVVDDGRGIPVDIHPKTKKSALETALCTLHAGGKFGGDSYKVSGGLHGVGVSVVNALSIWMKAEVHKDGGVWVQEYKKGVPQFNVKKIGKTQDTGTTITFQPDLEIFNTIEFDWKKIIEHLRQQAFLVKGVKIEVVDQRGDVPVYNAFCFEGGILSFLSYINEYDNQIQEIPFYVNKEYEGILVEASFVYNDDSDTQELSFANNIYTTDGGMHLTGFRSALTRALNDYARESGYIKEKEENFTGDDVREGLVAILSIKIREPQFEGQTKARLGNPPARTAVENVVAEALKEFLQKYSGEAKVIVGKCLLAQKARKAAKAAKDTVLRKGPLDGLTLPGKLADCTSKDPAESEIFIVEGDSAGGSGKQGRDRRTQAILPLRGKILNVEKARLDKMLANNEIKSLVIAMGTAIGSDFSADKIRYHKVIIMTDADIDGAHIRTLLLTMFYRYFKEVIERGYLYIAQPPLFRVQAGREFAYAFSDQERDNIVSRFQANKAAKKKASVKEKEVEVVDEQVIEQSDEEKTKGVSIQRYKGLGEMNPSQLWETTMNPETRMLKQVAIEDAQAADRLFDILMGEKVEPRKHFILSRASMVKNLDI